MAGTTGGGMMGLMGGGQQEPQQAEGSPAATQADLYQMGQRQQAQPVFGGAQASGQDFSGRINMIRQLLGSGQGGGGMAGQGGPTRVRQSAQPQPGMM